MGLRGSGSPPIDHRQDRGWKFSLGTDDVAVVSVAFQKSLLTWSVKSERRRRGETIPLCSRIGSFRSGNRKAAQRPADSDTEEALDLLLTTASRRRRADREKKKIDAGQRVAIEAFLGRHDDDGVDNPPLTILFERYYAERKLPLKTKSEWEGVCRRFRETTGGDLPARAVTQAHVRQFKTSLLTTTSKRTGNTMAPATVRKRLSEWSLGQQRRRTFTQ
jgi:hypothetical protein